ncbi:hypothetical protein PoB_004646600 [Plakobranchus ocellatus]|uniref:Uncharacterized protein n=1 Tax=Plakobranchus ocellatus TaxID=259542 RepID=A0AAV4B9C6_9GAST|nr:hypothetical protein PoB_004646600 [Plakobranchus ocellatus]
MSVSDKVPDDDDDDDDENFQVVYEKQDTAGSARTLDKNVPAGLQTDALTAVHAPFSLYYQCCLKEPQAY